MVDMGVGCKTDLWVSAENQDRVEIYGLGGREGGREECDENMKHGRGLKGQGKWEFKYHDS